MFYIGKWSHAGGSHVLQMYIQMYRDNMKKSSCLEPLGREPWYVASPSGPLPSLFKLCSLGQKWPRPRGHIGLYKINSFRIWSCCISKALVCSITKETSTKFVQIVPLGPKMQDPRALLFLILSNLFVTVYPCHEWINTCYFVCGECSNILSTTL